MANIIGIFSQKGGQGKSFITTLLATYIQTMQKKSVLIIDADFPQYTIYKIREEEKEYLQKNPDSLFSKKVIDTIKESNFVDIKPSKIIYLENLIQENNKKDYIFVDIVGTLNTEGINEKFFELFNLILVPSLVSRDDISSNLDYIYKILLPLKQNICKNLIFYLVFNQIDNHAKGDIKLVSQLKDFLKKHNIPFFKNYIFRKKIYSRMRIEDRNGEKTTFLPCKNLFLERFVSEFLTKIK